MSEMTGEAPPRRIRAFWPTVRRLLRLLNLRQPRMVLALILLVLCVSLQVAAPRVLGHAVDLLFAGVIGAQMPAGMDAQAVIESLRAQGREQRAEMLTAVDFVPGQGIDFSALAQTLLLALGMYAVAALFLWIQGRIINDVVMEVVYGLREEIEERVHRLPLSYFDSHSRGDLLSRTTNDMDSTQQALQQTLSQLLISLLTVLGIGVMMFILSWQLALVALIALPLSGVVIGLVGKRSQERYAAQWKATGELNGHIEEAFTGHSLMRVFGRREDLERRFDEHNEQLFQSAFHAQFLSGTMMPLMQFISYLGYVGIAVFGGLKVASGQMSLGQATAFIQYSRQFNQPISQLAGMAAMLQSGVAGAERIFELLDVPVESEDPVDPQRLPEPCRGEVRFENVSFSYSPQRQLITDLQLAVPPGCTVAIVGHTGAGKTTLVNLLMRFYDVDAGRILVDGVDLRDLTRADLRQQMGMVLQDATLFEGTIRENIRYGRLEATDDEVLEAAKAAYVDRFVHALPEGYDTVIDQEGGAISAGERQLITIARAFLAQPTVLILDEATSSVDTRTEALIQEAMAALRAQRTSFVIAHRLSTIRDAEVIVVMEQGRIIEQGSHAELLEARGAYAELYHAQFTGPHS